MSDWLRYISRFKHDLLNSYLLPASKRLKTKHKDINKEKRSCKFNMNNFSGTIFAQVGISDIKQTLQ